MTRRAFGFEAGLGAAAYDLHMFAGVEPLHIAKSYANPTRQAAPRSRMPMRGNLGQRLVNPREDAMTWYRKNRVNLMLRASGAALLWLAYFGGTWLRGRAAAGPIDGDAAAFALAAATFLCASGGSLLLVLGVHIFDQVEVASRWHHIDRSLGPSESDAQ